LNKNLSFKLQADAEIVKLLFFRLQLPDESKEAKQNLLGVPAQKEQMQRHDFYNKTYRLLRTSFASHQVRQM
jgi:hypothetical protein